MVGEVNKACFLEAMENLSSGFFAFCAAAINKPGKVDQLGDGQSVVVCSLLIPVTLAKLTGIKRSSWCTAAVVFA